MKNLLNHRLFEDEIESTKNYYGEVVCGNCMWFEEKLGRCTFRTYLMKRGIKPGPEDGKDPEEEIYYSSDGCKQWFD